MPIEFAPGGLEPSVRGGSTEARTSAALERRVERVELPSHHDLVSAQDSSEQELEAEAHTLLESEQHAPCLQADT